MPKPVLPRENTTLIVEAHGALPMSVQYATAGGPGDGAYVVVRSPDTLVYALDARAVAGVTYNLLLGRARAGRLLPRELRPKEQRFDRSVIGSVTLRGDRRISEPRAFADDMSPNGAAHMVMRVDGLTLRLYDQAALDAYTHAWIEAHNCIEPAFGAGLVPSVEALLHRATQQARTPYLLSALSMHGRELPGADRRSDRSSDLRSL